MEASKKSVMELLLDSVVQLSDAAGYVNTHTDTLHASILK